MTRNREGSEWRGFTGIQRRTEEKQAYTTIKFKKQKFTLLFCIMGIVLVRHAEVEVCAISSWCE